MNSIQAVILAAGRSKRFNTGRSKLMEKICGREMILYPIDCLQALSIDATLIVGYQKEEIISLVQSYYPNNTQFIEQTEQRGSGHAIMVSEPIWKANHILIVNGDAPLITEKLIEKLVDTHLTSGAAMTFVTSHNVDPTIGSYGKVVEEDNILKIVEAADFKGDTSVHLPVNAGIYLLKRSFLQEFIHKLPQSPVTNEYYFTEIVRLGSESGYKIVTHEVPFDRIRGVNTLRELWVAEQLKRSDLIAHWMEHGVRFSAAQTVHIDLDVTLGAGCQIGAGVQLFGKTTIGNNCIIEPYVIMHDAEVGHGAVIGAHSILTASVVSDAHTVEPFTYLKSNTVIHTSCNDMHRGQTHAAAFKTTVNNSSAALL